MFIDLTNKDTDLPFSLRKELIQLVTVTLDGVFVWTNFEDKVGFRVTQDFDTVLQLLDPQI